CVSPPTLEFSSFFLSLFGDHRDLHSFPTRRSSDLLKAEGGGFGGGTPGAAFAGSTSNSPLANFDPTLTSTFSIDDRNLPVNNPRSEEHTSELQSRENLVCRLLLEKKKKIKKQNIKY